MDVRLTDNVGGGSKTLDVGFINSKTIRIKTFNDGRKFVLGFDVLPLKTEWECGVSVEIDSTVDWERGLCWLKPK